MASLLMKGMQQAEVGFCALSQQETTGLCLGYPRTLCRAVMARKHSNALPHSPAQQLETPGPP